MHNHAIVLPNNLFYNLHFNSSENLRGTVPTWPSWDPVCHTTNNYTYINPDYPLYEISLDNHRTAYNFRFKVYTDNFRSKYTILISYFLESESYDIIHFRKLSSGGGNI